MTAVTILKTLTWRESERESVCASVCQVCVCVCVCMWYENMNTESRPLAPNYFEITLWFSFIPSG